jgi:glyoxylase-like metal-dependent hydrolase (beta-lactamase superfamily II)
MTVSQIDLNFMGKQGTIATYLIPHSNGAAIVDPGPETGLPVLIAALKDRGLTPYDVTHILVTHIHLDHAGAAGWFAAQGAQVCVHPVGVPHIMKPEKLIASAKRLYGEWMEKLWGEMQPVPAANLIEVQDESEIVAGDAHIHAIHTPGHAAHHVSYIFDDVIFSGDMGGTRFQPDLYLRLPFVPPETNLEQWRTSLKRMRGTGCGKIAPAHFGIYADAPAHLLKADEYLDAVEAWLVRNMPTIPDVETLQVRFSEFLLEHGRAGGLDDKMNAIYELGNPAAFAAHGLFRYWHKVRNIM